MDLGVMFFSSVEPAQANDRYRLLVEVAKFADANGFSCVWTPERHFHSFGGLFPNPAVLSAALAMVTERLQLRAGSLISPLHHTVRIVESWSVVDNLSDGRIGISFGAGWNIDDFIFFPENYSDRRAVMFRQIKEVRALWRGQRLEPHELSRRQDKLEVFPKPVQPELPIWVTSSGSVATFREAGKIGANVLTHLIGQSLEQLTEKIHAYRQARRENGFEPNRGKVTLMLHTFLGEDEVDVRSRVRQPFRNYLRSAISLERMAAHAGGAISGGHKVESHNISESAMEELLDLTFERYFQTGSLMGTPEKCKELIWGFEESGVDEIACLIDFIDDPAAIMASLELLAGLQSDFQSCHLEHLASSLATSFSEELR